MVVSKQVKPKKTGEPYLALTLGDRSGHIEAKMWDNVEDALDAFEQEDFIKVKGLLNKYKNRFQLTIHKLRRLGDSEVDFADYLPKTTKDIGELWRTLGGFVASFKDPHLKTLVESFMADPEIAEAYRNAPAAKTLHHAYIGGLLDHVVSLCRSCDLMCRNYPHVNRDLLLTGAFFHDIGKDSRAHLQPLVLLHHPRPIAWSHDHRTGDAAGQDRADSWLPRRTEDLLEHLIISHHGQYDFGSPKLPMFPEALMLHYLDDLDSKMESYAGALRAGGGSEGGWTSYNPSLGRPLLNTAKFLATKTVEELEEIAPDPPAPHSGQRGEADGTPLPAGLELPELEPVKENGPAAMTSAPHKHKI